VKSKFKKENLFTKDIDEEIGQLKKIFNKAYTSSCPVMYARKQYPPWWNQELAKLRKNSRKNSTRATLVKYGNHIKMH